MRSRQWNVVIYPSGYQMTDRHARYSAFDRSAERISRITLSLVRKLHSFDRAPLNDVLAPQPDARQP